MTYYDDIGEAYPWAVELPVAALSLDFLGVPGSVLGSDTAALIEKHGFPDNKRLGAGVVDGRSVWADGQTAPNLIGALIGKARPRAVSGAPARPGGPVQRVLPVQVGTVDLQPSHQAGCGPRWLSSAASAGSAPCTAFRAALGAPRAAAETRHAAVQGVKHISVQSSVSLQHLPYDKDLEHALPAEIVGRLAFAKQKLGEIVAAAKAAPGVKPVPLTSALPTVGAPRLCRCSAHAAADNPQARSSMPLQKRLVMRAAGL